MELTNLNRTSPSNPSLQSSRNHVKEEQKNCKTQRNWITPGDGHLNQVKNVYINSQKLKQQARCQHGTALSVLHIYYSSLFSKFVEPLCVNEGLSDCSSTFAWSLLLLLLFLVKVKFNLVFFLIFLFSHRSLFYSSKRKKERGCGSEGRS